jgi:hypothetical protein
MLKRVCSYPSLSPPHPIIHDSTKSCPAEAFLLFSQAIPTTNLGFVDSRASSLDVTISGNEYTVHQSPTLLSSSRAGGTTGAGMYLFLFSMPYIPWIISCSELSTRSHCPLLLTLHKLVLDCFALMHGLE